MNTEELKSFILEASKNTYASEDKSIRQVQSDKSTTITYQRDNWKYHDNYFGGEPYGGREVVFWKEKPVWMMVYYGRVIKENNLNIVYRILTKALRNASLDMPYRGPTELINRDLKYTNKINGEVDNFF